MYCTECGHRLKEKAKFCSKCGAQAKSGGKKKPSKKPKQTQKKQEGIRIPVPALVIGGFILVFVLGLLVFDNSGQTPVTSGVPTQTYSADVLSVAQNFMCPCGECNDNLAICDCASPNGGQEVKQFITNGLSEGITAEQMITAVQLKYQVLPIEQSQTE